MVICARLFPFYVRRCVGTLSFFYVYIYLVFVFVLFCFFAEKNPYSQIRLFSFQVT